MKIKLLKQLSIAIFLSIVFTNFSNAQSFLWAKGIGSANIDEGTKIKVDASGNVYTVGIFLGSADFNPGAGTFTMTPSGGSSWYDVFITKFDASGNFLWAKQVGSTLNDVPFSLELDNANNLILSGYFNGTVDFDPGAGIVNLTSAGNEDAFVMKLTDQGNFVWAKRVGGAQNDRAHDVAIDASNNVYVTGVFNVSGDFDPGAAVHTLTATNQDSYVLKLDASGNYVWLRQITGSGNEVAQAIEVDAGNNVIVGGNFTATADFDPGAGVVNATAVATNDIFILKLDVSGTYVYYKTIGGTGDEFIKALTTDANSNIVAVGYFTGSLDVDPGVGTTTLTSAGGNDGLMVQLNNSGNLNWFCQLASATSEMYNDIDIDASNNIVGVGTMSTGVIDFDPGAGTSNLGSSGFDDGFIQRLSATGSFMNVWKISSSFNSERIFGVASIASGEIFTTGAFGAAFDIDPSSATYTLPNQGSLDIFIHKMGCVVPAAPTNTSTFGDLNICANSSTVLSASGNGTLGWYTQASGGTYLGGGSSFNTGNLTTNTTFFVQDSTCTFSATRTPISVSVTNLPVNQNVTPLTSNICSGGNATITVANSETGVYYSLVNDATDVVVQGPVMGTGSALNFNLTGITSTTSYHVTATKPTSSNNMLNLDGVNDYVDYGTNNRGIVSYATISAKVKTTVNGASQFIVAKYLSGGIGYYLYINATGYASIQGRDVAGSIKSSGFSTTMVADNQWHEITGVIRGGVWEIWVDGVMQNSGTYTIGGTGLGTTAALLVGQFGGTYSPLDIDRLAIWNVALTPALILSNATGCLSGSEANLVAYASYNQSSGTVSTDLSPSALNGTLMNMTAPACWQTGPANNCYTACDVEMNDIVTVNVVATPSQPTITPSGPTTLCAGGSVTLTSSSGTSYLWSNGATTQSIVVNAAGTYTVQVSNGSCQSTPSAGTVVTVNALPTTPTITVGGPTTFCAGGSVTLTSSAGNTYLWSNGATTPSINVTTAGTYTVQVTNASGCQSAASLGTTVTVNALPTTPTITAGGSTTFCAGGSVTLTSSAGSSYLWSNGATTPSINITTAGTYTVQITNAAGCQSAASAGTLVTVNSLPTTPTITAGGPTTFCAGGSVTLTSSAGSSYLWSNGATTPSINITTAGTYTVQITNAAGCQSVASAGTLVTVSALPTTPTITAGGPTTFCAGGSVTLTSSAGSSYLWSNGATTPTINATTAGTYTVQVSNAAGCQSAASTGTAVTVNALPTTPTITAGGPTTFCTGGSVTLTSSAGSSYLWSNGATTPSINITTAGTYTVQITNAAGCQSAASAGTAVTVNALPTTPTITAGGPTTFCAGGSVTLTSSAGSSYLWSNGATTPSINITTAGTYTVQVTNATGCQSAASAGTTVTVNSASTIALGTLNNPTSCSTANGSIQITGTGTGDLSWSGAASGSLTGVTLPTTIPALNDGSYTISFVNASGCNSNTVNVTLIAPSAPAAPSITANNTTTFCAGGSVTLTSSTGVSYQWSTGETSQSIVVSTGGNYTVSITDASGCSSSASAVTSVTVNALPVISTGTLTNPSTCTTSDGSIEVTGSGTGDLAWSGTASGSASSVVLPFTINNLSNGTYTMTFTDQNGCASAGVTGSLTLPSAPPAPTVTPSGSTTFCTGDMVTLTSSVGDAYLWSNGETTQSITVNSSDNYSVIITDASGCTSPSSAVTTVTVNAIPVASTTVSGITITANPTGANYTWIDCATNQAIAGQNSQDFTPSSNGSYAVVVTQNGCSDTSACVLITTVGIDEVIGDLNLQLYPNPTNDLVNVVSNGTLLLIELHDLKGTRILTTTKDQFSMNHLPSGVYFATVYYEQGTQTLKVIKN